MIQPLAQLVRVAGLHPAGRRFESCTVHWEHGMFPRCCYALLVVVHVTAWARVVGLRASRWACYYALIAARCPPGLPSCIVSVAELADALDLGSSAFGRVGSTPTGRTSGRGFRSFLLPLASRSCYSGWARLAGLTQLVECSSCKRDAGGSSPPSGSGVDGGA